MSIAIIIPARYASTRLPGKPLIEVGGKPVIQWVYEKASASKLAQKVIVATDDERIFDAVKAFGGEAVMTREDHKSGSDRIFEVLTLHPEITVAVNVQGDEPLITPESIDAAINTLISDDSADISTLVREIDTDEEFNNPNVVKAVFDNFQNALYFSRSAIPFHRNSSEAENYAHIGLYVYRNDALKKMTELPQSSLELAESLEQLRALQNGMRIKIAVVDYKPIGIDTPEDVEEFKKLLNL